MPPERRPIELDPSPAETVVESGTEKAPRRRRWSAAGLGRSLTGDRRLVPPAAALGAVTLLTALVSEWQVTTVDAAVFGSDGESGESGDQLVPTDVTDLGGLGAAVLVGLFPLVAAVVLTLFGPPAARRWVRLAGLSVGGTLLGLLFALTVSLGRQSRVVSDLYTMSLDPGQVEFGYGRGLWCAMVGVFLAMLALYLGGRATPTPQAVVEEQPAVWTWRRPPADSSIPEEPLELTVGPAKPFTSRADDRDRPSGP